MSKIDFDLLSEYLRTRDADSVKKLVTRDNILDRDRNGDGIIAHILWHFHDDSNGVMLIRYFFDLGASLHAIDDDMLSLLHVAAYKGKPKSTKKLLNLGIPVDICDEDKMTPLHLAFKCGAHKDCAQVLLDAGAQLSLVPSDVIPQWARDFVVHRNTLRDTSVIVLGLKQCDSNVLNTSGNGSDILQIIARCVWELRGTNI